MNHLKIKECAEQAGFTYEDHTYNINKLVGIIVQECINCCYIVEEHCASTGNSNETVKTVRETMAISAATCAEMIQAKFV